MEGKLEMKEFPLVTCCVLSYNHFEHIYATLDSILSQSYSQIELAIYDDGSLSFPQKDIEKFIYDNRGSNIVDLTIHHNAKNLGTVKNINQCARTCRGEYLLITSCDDVFYDSNSISNVIEYFRLTDADMVTCYREIISEEGNFIRQVPSERIAKIINTSTPQQLFKRVSMGIAIAGAGTYYSKKFLVRMNYFDENYFLQEDGPMFIRALRLGCKLCFLEKKVIKYRLGKGVSSGTEINPLLVRDINLMFAQEVFPYIDEFSFFEKRRIFYQRERLRYPKELSLKHKFLLILKYPDVIIYRKKESI